MYKLEKIKKIEPGIKECIRKLSDKIMVKELKTQEVSADIKKIVFT